MIHFILGTRAQLIKTAPVMVECRNRNIPYNFVFLAQHRQTIYEIIDLFEIKRPDFIIGDEGQDIDSVRGLIHWSAKVLLAGLKKRHDIFRGDSKGIVLVHGDALPALMGAFLAKAATLKVGHVEAGLRSFNFKHPFPEELIRVLLWKLKLSDYYFCPNDWALKNVAGYKGKKFNTECNTLYDSLRIASEFRFVEDRLLIPKEKFAIVTLHRFENLSSRQRLEAVLEIIDRITKQIKLLFILHPPTLLALKQSGLYDVLERKLGVELRPRYDYFRFVRLLQESEFVITDGGSNQEECFYLGHPCLLLRHKTERMEGLGQNAVLSKFDSGTIQHFLENYSSFRREGSEKNARPSEMIITALNEYW